MFVDESSSEESPTWEPFAAFPRDDGMTLVVEVIFAGDRPEVGVAKDRVVTSAMTVEGLPNIRLLLGRSSI